MFLNRLKIVIFMSEFLPTSTFAPVSAHRERATLFIFGSRHSSDDGDGKCCSAAHVTNNVRERAPVQVGHKSPCEKSHHHASLRPQGHMSDTQMIRSETCLDRLISAALSSAFIIPEPLSSCMLKHV